MFLPPIICVALAQWLKFRQWEVKFDNYQWMAANFKGIFIACMIVLIIGIVVGIFQRPVLDFLYNDHSQVARNNLLLSLFFILLPLLGSMITSIVVAIDVLKWEFKRSNRIDKKA